MKKLILIFMFVGFAIHSYSQDIKGFIFDQHSQPLPTAMIYWQSTNVHTHSDQLGAFNIPLFEGVDTLIVSYLGYETKKIAIKNQSFIEIKMNPTQISLDEIIVTPVKRMDEVVSSINTQLNPVRSSQEVLRVVPGLFIGQHAGGGKAEQIFLRGFDIDHGTDVSIKVDGMPVNMVSHAHGQGYADLHFVIPETIEKVAFEKGPYHAGSGNFATAGHIEYQTKKRVDRGQITFEVGQFNHKRSALLLPISNNDQESWYLAGEFRSFDGPFETPQLFERVNAMTKYTKYLDNGSEFSLGASHFYSNWDASGQIPQRAVDQGMIGRFGAIDDTEGGNTSRTNVFLDYSKILSGTTSFNTRAWYSFYDFRLFSNFTFFLDDPINGDQIRQQESRHLFGFESNMTHAFVDVMGFSGQVKAAVGMRQDRSGDNELAKTVNRTEVLFRTQLGDVSESNLYGFLESEWIYGDWTFLPGIRFDYFDNGYRDQLTPQYDIRTVQNNFVSPSLSAFYTPTRNLQYYVKVGRGFHSNDTRIALFRDNHELLTAALGYDVGVVLKPTRNMVIDGAFWYLDLEEELVYVGDAGVVEPSGQSRRLGFDLGINYQINPFFSVRIDANYAKARSLEDPDGEDLIPLATTWSSLGRLNYKSNHGWYGSISYRYLADRPANEDNSIVAPGYFVLDASVGKTFNRWNLGIIIENVLDTEWNEAQFATLSRLPNEIEPVEEIHFTPGFPFFITGQVSFKF